MSSIISLLRTATVLSLVWIVLIPAAGLAENLGWREMMTELTSSDSARREAARPRANSVVRRLMKEDPAELVSDLKEIAETLGDPSENIRMQTAGLLAATALVRADGAETFAKVVPALIQRLEDSSAPVRFNAVSALANLKPDIPPDAIEALTSALRDSDARVTASAAQGLARSATDSSIALDSLIRALDGGSTPQRRAILDGIGAARKYAPGLVPPLKKLLADAQAGLQADTLRTVGLLGPSAVEAVHQEIEILAETSDSNGVAEAAKSILVGRRR